MFKNLKMSSKLYFGFGIIIVMLLLVAGSSLWLTDGILKENERFMAAADHSEFIVAKEVDHLTWLSKVMELFQGNQEHLDVQLDHAKCGLGKFLYSDQAKTLMEQDPKFAVLLEEIKEPHRQLHESAKNINTIWKQRHPGLRNRLKDLLADLDRWSEDLYRMILTRDPAVELETDPLKSTFGGFLQSKQYAEYAQEYPLFRDTMGAVKDPYKVLFQSAAQIRTLLNDGKTDEAVALFNGTTLKHLSEIRSLVSKVVESENALLKSQDEAHDMFDAQTLPALEATQVKLKAIRDLLQTRKAASTGRIREQGAASLWSVIIIGSIALILGVALSFLLVRSISRPINKAIASLRRGAEQVAASSIQVATASQSLAEGASEQAAAIEETSSSLEEMSAMTNQNAENAGHADVVMREAKTTAGKAGQSMSKLSTSMDEISNASAETSKIIKTIDEIAFQTNLLALNAAVEAARAGEAGAGFAVVADEVRNLAMRAAEAAKNTADLIQGTLSRVNEGSTFLRTTNEDFAELAASASKAGDLVTEIATASEEQAQGIEQVNKAITEMDKVTQQNAANAEESASAAQEMNAQAALMRKNVTDLLILVEGKKAHTGGNGSNAGEAREVRTLHTSYSHIPQKEEGVKISLEDVAPERRIPLKKDDFEDF